jgi:hypothetical protein
MQNNVSRHSDERHDATRRRRIENERGAAREMHAETDLVHVGPPRGKRRRIASGWPPESPVLSSALVPQDCLHHRGAAKHQACPTDAGNYECEIATQCSPALKRELQVIAALLSVNTPYVAGIPRAGGETMLTTNLK